MRFGTQWLWVHHVCAALGQSAADWHPGCLVWCWVVGLEVESSSRGYSGPAWQVSVLCLVSMHQFPAAMEVFVPGLPIEIWRVPCGPAPGGVYTLT